MPFLIIGGVLALVLLSDKIPLFQGLFNPTNSPVGAGGPGQKQGKQGVKNQSAPNPTLGSPGTSPNATLQTIEGAVAIANQALGHLKDLKTYTESDSDGDSEYPVTQIPNPGYRPPPIVFTPINLSDYTDSDSSDSSFASTPSDDSFFSGP